MDRARKVPDIRLVEIIGSTESHAPIGVRLHTFLLADEPKYALISYARDGDESGSIDCDGRPLSVSSKLLAMLRSLRERNSSGVKYFWVDVICLNQDAQEEVYTQSMFMRNMTLQATVTIVWTEVELTRNIADFLAESARILPRLRRSDPASGDIGLLQNSANIVASDLLQYELFHREAISRLSAISWLGVLGSYVNPMTFIRKLYDSLRTGQGVLDEDDAFKTISSLLGSAQFGRMLALPDLVLSKCVVLRCGLVDLTWSVFCDAVYVMVMYGTHEGLKSSQVENLLGANLLRQRYHDHQLSFAESLLAMAGCNFEETHTADFIFPLIALNGSGTREERLPHIDYSEGEQQVLQSIATAINAFFSMPVNLSLSGLPTDNNRAGLPTWLPDFGPKQRMLFAHPNSKFPATKATENSFIADASGCGKCFGYRIDTVTTVKSYLAPRRICDQYDLAGDNLFELLRWYKFACGIDGDITRESSIVQFAETIQARGSNHLWEQHHDAQETIIHTKAFMDYLENSEIPETHDIRLYYAACLPAHDRKFGQTAAGRFCLLPATAQALDMVYMIHGSKAPILLRHSNAGYLNIGECYVHGLMHGEFSDMEEDCIVLE